MWVACLVLLAFAIRAVLKEHRTQSQEQYPQLRDRRFFVRAFASGAEEEHWLPSNVLLRAVRKHRDRVELTCQPTRGHDWDAMRAAGGVSMHTRHAFLLASAVPFIDHALRSGFLVAVANKVDEDAFRGLSTDSICELCPDFVASPPEHLYLMWLADSLQRSNSATTFSDVLCGPRGGKAFHFYGSLSCCPELKLSNVSDHRVLCANAACLVCKCNRIVILLPRHILPRSLRSPSAVVEGW